jgi:hypothetical protein
MIYEKCLTKFKDFAEQWYRVLTEKKIKIWNNGKME